MGLFAMLIAAFASIGYDYGYMGSTWSIGISSGAFTFWVGPLMPAPLGWFWFSSSSPWFHWPTWGTFGQWWNISIPLWLPCVAIAIPTFILWWRGRRHPPGHCQRCGYDLTGNVTGVCSECEEPISTEKT